MPISLITELAVISFKRPGRLFDGIVLTVPSMVRLMVSVVYIYDNMQTIKKALVAPIRYLLLTRKKESFKMILLLILPIFGILHEPTRT